MAWQLDDVIVALGSAPGSASRGIIRATGPSVASFLDDRFKPDDPDAWRTSRVPRRHAGTIAIPQTRSMIPLAVHSWPTARSYTGQPLVELHLPGSPPLLDAVITEWCRHGARLARPGEFTLRAFLAGKLDLLQAEAVLGVIDADDSTTLHQALDQLAGGVSHALSAMRNDLLNLLADLEAGLDFVEEHLEFVARGEMLARIATARQFVEKLAQQTVARLHHGERPRIVLAGLPNAGKSTLFNALAGKDAALVSEQAGTTRDFLEVRIDCQGIAFDLIDTAGWEDTTQAIAADAQEKRAAQLARADLIVWCSPADATPAEMEVDTARRAACSHTRIIHVMTKVDQPEGASPRFPSGEPDASAFRLMTGRSGVIVSARTGLGMDDLRRAIVETWGTTNTSSWSWLGATAARCLESVQATLTALEHAEAAAADPVIGDELIAVELRDALDHLGRIVGAVYTDDLLDRIFSRFCIGK